jgi:DNA-binding SARP family transcriptional activator/pimeloyl-ACP methyl ester carboxylesterase/class 3 adenylate cyclase
MGMRAHLTERVRLEVGDTVVDEASLPGRQDRLALAYLLVEHDRPVPRDELAELLWRGEPPQRWEKGLAVVLSKLRAVLTKSGMGEGVLTHAFGCYQLHLPSDTWIDVEAAAEAADLAESALARDDAADARRWAVVAAALARRIFLPGEEGLWVETKRVDLVVVLRRALDCTSSAALLLGDPAGAMAAASEAVALEPYRELAYLHLIRAQAAAGNRAEALHTYERCRRLLAEELGVDPSPQTEAVYLTLVSAGSDHATSPASSPGGTATIVDPEIQYAKTGDVDVAYQVFGADSPDLLTFSSGMLPIDSMNDEPSLARFNNRLASIRRLIRFDVRGVGMSDAVGPSSPPTLEQWMHDALAVLDAAGSESAAVFAPRDASLVAIMLAAAHPDRVSSLVIVNGTARIARAEDYPIGTPRWVLDRFLELNPEPDAVDRGLDMLAIWAPTVSNDSTFRAWWNRAGNRGASPATARLIDRVRLHADVRPLVPLVRTPTLILHTRDNRVTRAAHGRYLADHMPNATYVELAGADDLYWVGDTTTMLDEIEAFLTGARHGAEPDRVLATVVFIEMAGSSDELHDRDRLKVRLQLERFRGREVNATTDGVVATFDGPARAVSCACAIRDAAVQLGVEVRVGVHIGEVEARGDDIGGMALQIAARVAALAKPREVLVSRTVVDVIVGSGIETADRGEHAFEGIPGTWRLFAVEG